ncbi:MAG: hypothetical protein E7H57_19810, partial [Pantoea sp.]|nr:hypothetical protein [Pantoea sp.]
RLRAWQMNNHERKVLAGLRRIEIRRWRSLPDKQYMVDLMEVALEALTTEPTHHNGMMHLSQELAAVRQQLEEQAAEVDKANALIDELREERNLLQRLAGERGNKLEKVEVELDDIKDRLNSCLITVARYSGPARPVAQQEPVAELHNNNGRITVNCLAEIPPGVTCVYLRAAPPAPEVE